MATIGDDSSGAGTRHRAGLRFGREKVSRFPQVYRLAGVGTTGHRFVVTRFIGSIVPGTGKDRMNAVTTNEPAPPGLQGPLAPRRRKLSPRRRKLSLMRTASRAAPRRGRPPAQRGTCGVVSGARLAGGSSRRRGARGPRRRPKLPGGRAPEEVFGGRIGCSVSVRAARNRPGEPRPTSPTRAQRDLRLVREASARLVHPLLRSVAHVTHREHRWAS